MWSHLPLCISRLQVLLPVPCYTRLQPHPLLMPAGAPYHIQSTGLNHMTASKALGNPRWRPFDLPRKEKSRLDGECGWKNLPDKQSMPKYLSLIRWCKITDKFCAERYENKHAYLVHGCFPSTKYWHFLNVEVSVLFMFLLLLPLENIYSRTSTW